MHNGYIDGFNGKRCGEHFNESWLETLRLVRTSVASWRKGYREVMLRSSLGRITWARFEGVHRQRAGGADQHPSTQKNRLTLNLDSYV